MIFVCLLLVVALVLASEYEFRLPAAWSTRFGRSREVAGDNAQDKPTERLLYESISQKYEEGRYLFVVVVAVV